CALAPRHGSPERQALGSTGAAGDAVPGRTQCATSYLNDNIAQAAVGTGNVHTPTKMAESANQPKTIQSPASLTQASDAHAEMGKLRPGYSHEEGTLYPEACRPWRYPLII